LKIRLKLGFQANETFREKKAKKNTKNFVSISLTFSQNFVFVRENEWIEKCENFRGKCVLYSQNFVFFKEFSQKICEIFTFLIFLKISHFSRNRLKRNLAKIFFFAGNPISNPPNTVQCFIVKKIYYDWPLSVFCLKFIILII